MREARNPFRLSAAEHFESDDIFLRLFGPAMLLPLRLDENGIEKFRIIQSAPGGGKTTLMRLFTPGSLKALHTLRGHDEIKELHSSLQEIGVLNSQGPQLLGAMVSCSKTFADISDIGLNDFQQQGCFLALLDARLILSGLNAFVELKAGRFPEDLTHVEVSVPAELQHRLGFSAVCSGSDLYEWAKEIEKRICSALFSFEPGKELPQGHDDLMSPFLFAARNLCYKGQGGVKQVLFMLDDAHCLATKQRKGLIKLLVDLRAPTGVWIAERLEALTLDELIESGAVGNRDYVPPIRLENHWQRRKADFRKFLENVADRRARNASDAVMHTFSGCLESDLDMNEWESVLDKAQQAARASIEALSAGTQKFDGWIADCNNKVGTPLARTLDWRRLEILIRRELAKKQHEFEFELNTAEYNKKDDASLQEAGRAFLAKDHGVPYYYGLDRLIGLASYNIEQFLMLAGDVFEESVSLALIQERPALSVKRQHELVVKASSRLWEDVPRRAGEDVHKLLVAIAEFSRWYTFRPTAPNDPGVNGIAILMSDRRYLLSPTYLKKRPEHKLVADVIARAIQFNFLVPEFDYRCKGKDFMLLNLNRLLCPKYGLPLGLGLFKEQRLDVLAEWIRTGFENPQKAQALW